ncbi:AAA family ATPase [Fulvivirgaceae bacterium BMA10]|uniref:AAA family ATPase n=1 Tax=Splendidivirga corallicola TaxID=3051826 RepID=A0ABT8KLM5_9BACT|nr:AAA family ATPase [Fulvivirgaceae bacterium BMA10]
MDEENIKNLKEALRLSPNNTLLRLHLAEMLLKANQLVEAENEFKTILEIEVGNIKAKRGLLKTYYEQKKYSTAIIIAEELTNSDQATPDILLIYAQLLYKENEIRDAIELYQKVLVLDPTLTDPELDKNLRNFNAGGDVEQNNFVADLDNSLFEKPDINFDHVGGMDRVKEEINIKIIQPLEHPELYAAYGKKVGGGILLYGPPGCGKTHLAKATAGQISAKFISVGINDILDMWVGNSEKNLHELFESARRNAPCVLFFDEVDALGASRSDMRQSAGRALINQFLSEMDGIEYSNEGVLILGATNAPWHLDPAFRRPGRFDRIIFVQPPDLDSRINILEILLKGKPLNDIDFKAIAKKTDNFSGADLRAMVDICIEEKLRASFKTGVPEPMETKDLLKAAKQLKPSTKEWFSSARNYALYANDSGLYDDILDYLNIKK